MKAIFFALSLFVFLSVEAQIFPDFSEDSIPWERKKSIILKILEKKYSTFLSMTYNCYWPVEQTFFVVGYDGKKWSRLFVSVKYKDRDAKSFANIKSKRIEVNSEDSSRVQHLIEFLTANSFWKFSNDSLNTHTKVENPYDTAVSVSGSKDSVVVTGKYVRTTTISISDGCSTVFEIYNKEKYKQIYSYLPERFQQEIPIKQRELFLACEKEYTNFWTKP